MKLLPKIFAPRRIKLRACDALLTAERATPADLGLRYVGDLKPVGEALAGLVRALSRIADTAQRKRVAAAVTRDLASSTASSSSAERPAEFKLDREPDLGDAPEFNIGMGASAAQVNDANIAYWNRPKKAETTRDNAPRQLTTRDTIKFNRALAAPSMATRIEAINELNRKFYG